MNILTKNYLLGGLPARNLAAVAGLLIGCAGLAAAQTIYIDFGRSLEQMPSPNGSTYWNNVTNLDASVAGSGSVGFNIGLVNADNSASGITLTMTDLFENENNAGTTSPNTSISEFNFAKLGQDSLFIQNSNPTAGFTLTGLDPTKTYQFTVFASRNAVADVRSADYTFTGGNSDTITLDSSNNVSNIATTINITPNGSDAITFSMVKAASNTNGSGFAYLGGIQIVAVPEPGTYAAIIGSVVLFGVAIARRRKRTVA